jgi:hypothetical protein
MHKGYKEDLRIHILIDLGSARVPMIRHIGGYSIGCAVQLLYGLWTFSLSTQPFISILVDSKYPVRHVLAVSGNRIVSYHTYIKPPSPSRCAERECQMPEREWVEASY